MGLFAQERQAKILEFILAGKKARVSELVANFGVSEATVRRDLTELEKLGRLVKTYGGAIIADSYPDEFSYQDRLEQNMEEKQRIGRYAASLVNPGDSLFLDSGTTSTQIAEALKERDNITVITNSIVIAQILGHSIGIRLYVAGGLYRPTSMDMLGPLLHRTLRGFSVELAFLSVDGFDAESGLSASDPGEAEAARAAMGIAKRTIIVADSSKGGKSAFAHIGSFSDIEILVTDNGLSRETRDSLTKVGVHLEIL